MRILILGSNGMLGHKLFQQFQKKHDVYGTARKHSLLLELGICTKGKIVFDVDPTISLPSLVYTLDDIKPDAVVNCIGIIKQQENAKDPILSIKTNALLPHEVNKLCKERGIKFIHISTDCVFSGKKGDYTEADNTDPEDLYGKTKALGEVWTYGLTLRTSIIGRELRTKYGLVEWFLSQSNKTVRGFTKAIYTGFTTIELANVILKILEGNYQLEGLYHISSPKIDKFSLLKIINRTFKPNATIEENSLFTCDRSLNSSLLKDKIQYFNPSWEEMIEDMWNDNLENGGIYGFSK
jgi:dTDP-4-dehydrorhamnose reductase